LISYKKAFADIAGAFLLLIFRGEFMFVILGYSWSDLLQNVLIIISLLCRANLNAIINHSIVTGYPSGYV